MFKVKVVDGKVPFWTDKHGINHVVIYTGQDPCRIPCIRSPVWGYKPKFITIESITCEKCKSAMG